MRCRRCQVEFIDIAGRIRLTGEHPQVHCPLCGQRCGFFSAPGVFWNECEHYYWAWMSNGGLAGELGGFVEKRFSEGRLTVELQARPVSLQDCLFPRVVLFKSAEDAPDPAHFTPVRPEFELWIQRCELLSWTSHTRTYEVLTRDGYRDFVTLPALEVVDTARAGAALYVWPNFVAPGWKRYYIAFFDPEKPGGSGKILWVEGRTEQPCDRRREEINHRYGQVDFVPDSVVLVWNQDGMEYFARYRTREPTAAHLTEETEGQAYRRVSGLTMGFDFGTTNSSAAVFFADTVNREFALAIRDRTLRLLDGEVADAENTWLPQPRGICQICWLPSQLYFQDPHFWVNVDGGDFRPVRDFTIPYNQALAGQADQRVASEFKWKKRLPHPGAAAGLRRLYFSLALQLFLAELVAGYRILPSEMRLVATYPLAFEPEDVQLHDGILEQVRPLVEQATGFQIILSPGLDESHAAEACGEIISEADVTLFMDVGGGTTDLCVSQPAGADRLVPIVDSIEFGGEDLNRSIEPLAGITPAELRRAIRTEGATVYSDARRFQSNEQNVRTVGDVIRRFHAGLIEITARFVAAVSKTCTPTPAKIGVLMLGHGWKTLFPGIEDHSEISQKVESSVKSRLEKLKRDGVIEAVATVACRYPTDPKGVIAAGAAKRIALAFKEVRPERRSYLLENVDVTVGNQVQRFFWYDKIPIPFAAVPQRMEIIEDPFGLGCRPDGPLSGLMRGQELVGSPFGFVMATCYKMHLRAVVSGQNT